MPAWLELAAKRACRQAQQLSVRLEAADKSSSYPLRQPSGSARIVTIELKGKRWFDITFAGDPLCVPTTVSGGHDGRLRGSPR